MMLKFSKCVIVLCSVLVVALAQPAFAVVYDFDRCGTAGYIHGKDNWTANPSGSGGLEVQPDTNGQGVDPCGDGSGLVLTDYGGTSTKEAWRTNDGNWSFDLTGRDKIIVGAHYAIDYTVSAYYGHAKVALRNTATGKEVTFGINIKQWYYGESIWDAMGTENLGTQPRPPTSGSLGQVWDYRLEIDLNQNWNAQLSAYEGGGTLYTMHRGEHTEWQAIGNLSNVNLKLATSGMNIQAADQLHVSIKTRIAGMDSLVVAVPSGTMTVETFLDKNLDGVKNGSDEVLSGWAYNVGGPCACGDYGPSPYSGTTDGSGQAVIAGGTAAMAGLEDGDYATTVTRQTYYTAAGGNPASVSVAAGATNTNADFGFRPVLGDANVDGTVNLSDFTILKAGFGSAGLWANANFNEDTVVNLSDFTILKAEFGNSHPDKLGGAAVPDPATMGLVALGALGLLRRRRR